MTTLDLHPEELFDKADRGELSAGERVLLDAHLARCELCRFERQAALDFASLPLPALDVERLVTNALTAHGAPRLGARVRSRRAPVLLAAAVALGALGSFAAVGQWTGVLPRLIAAMAGAPPPAVAQAPPLAAPPAPPEAQREPELTPPPARPAPPAPPLPRRARALEPSAVPPSAPPLLEAHLEASSPPPPDPPMAPPTAAEVFAAGTHARLAGDRPLAMARYRQLLTAWPTSAEASQTRASLGRLLLDEGSPSSALEQLEGYLANPAGELREEVLTARAQALSRLGRPQDEAQAWTALLAEYPGSIHGLRARARLASLGTPLP